MKRKFILLSCVLFIFISGAHAQLAGSELFGNRKSDQSQLEFKKNCFGLDLGIGSVKDGEGTEFGFGIRWLHNFSPYIGWDILNVKALANSKDIVTTIVPQIMSGIRGTTPTLFAKMSTYATFNMGYGYHIDSEIGGLCYEFGFGVNLTKKVFIGYAYNFQGGSKEEEYTVTVGKKSHKEKINRELKQKYHAFRLGFNF